jgi:hypothetical protein
MSANAAERAALERLQRAGQLADGVVHLLLLGPETTATDAGGKPAWSYGGGKPPAGAG